MSRAEAGDAQFVADARAARATEKMPYTRGPKRREHVRYTSLLGFQKGIVNLFCHPVWPWIRHILHVAPHACCLCAAVRACWSVSAAACPCRDCVLTVC